MPKISPISPQVQLSIDEAIFKAWASGMGTQAAVESVKRTTGHLVSKDTIRKAFVKHANFGFSPKSIKLR